MLSPKRQGAPAGQVLGEGHFRGQAGGLDGQVAAKLEVIPAQPGLPPLGGQETALGAAEALLEFVGQPVEQAVPA